MSNIKLLCSNFWVEPYASNNEGKIMLSIGLQNFKKKTQI